MNTIVITTSRNSSIRMRQFLNELEPAIPNAIKVNRGKLSITELAGKALSMGATRIIYFGSRGGNPGFIRFLRIKEGLIEVLPYFIRILGVKLFIDMNVRVEVTKKSSSGVIVSLGGYTEVADVLSEQLGLPSLKVFDFESIRGMYDTILLIRRVQAGYEVQILNGRDLGPYGPFMRISDIIYTKPRVIRIE
ncbi:MAG: Brix domain-containing protein [Vulcanisaeta sp.]